MFFDAELGDELLLVFPPLPLRLLVDAGFDDPEFFGVLLLLGLEIVLLDEEFFVPVVLDDDLEMLLLEEFLLAFSASSIPIAVYSYTVTVSVPTSPVA